MARGGTRYSKFLFKILLLLIGFTVLYISLYAWLLHYWYPLDAPSRDTQSNTVHVSYDEPPPQEIPTSTPDTVHPSSHKLYNSYQNKPLPSRNLQHYIFDLTTMPNKEIYSMSLHNHYHPLYTNQSNHHQLFYYHKPKCIHQSSQLPMCFISDCHDMDPQLHFHQSLANPSTEIRKSRSLQQRLMQPGRKWGERLNPMRIPDVNLLMDHEENKDNASLPTRWIKYRANITTNEPYQHLIYRTNGIRILKGTRSTSCFVSHRHKFVFVHVLKSGGTSMSGFLCYALCNSTAMKQCDKEILRKISCKKLKPHYPEYFYFAIVRNPYNRVFSLWAHQMIKSLEKRFGKRKKRLDINAKLKHKSMEMEKNNVDKKLDIHRYSRQELLVLFAEFVSRLRFTGIRRSSRKTGVSSDHYYEQHYWLFDHTHNCPIVDFIGHLENIEYDIQYILNLITDNEQLMDYYIENGEYWKVNTYGTNLKQMLYNNSKEREDGLSIKSLTDIFELSAKLSGTQVQKWAAQLYEVDFDLFGYDINTIDNNLLVPHMQSE